LKGVWKKTKRRKGRVRVLYSRVSWVVDPPVSRIDHWCFDPVRSRPLAEESLAGQVAATGSRSVEACLRRQVPPAQSLLALPLFPFTPPLPLHAPSLDAPSTLLLLSLDVPVLFASALLLSVASETSPKTRGRLDRHAFWLAPPRSFLRDPQPPGARERVRSSKKRRAAMRPLYTSPQEGRNVQTGGTEGVFFLQVVRQAKESSSSNANEQGS
jgi:hypothetical protein